MGESGGVALAGEEVAFVATRNSYVSLDVVQSRAPEPEDVQTAASQMIPDARIQACVSSDL